MSTVIRSTSYEIFIGNDTFLQTGKFLSKNHPGRKLFVLVDEHTKQHCLPLITGRVPMLNEATVLEIESGEKSKSLRTCENLWEQLTSARADRRSLLINLGGGVVGDVGGFVAATYMRGIDFVNIPTTLLAMVDASAGGKNGINFSGLKNQVGTFARPGAVFISPSFLKTLPERELKSGFAEVVKHALIAEADKWEEIKKMDSLHEVNWTRIIGNSVFIKNKIVNADYRDRHLRKTLNFGHTIGHALESYSLAHHVDPLRHGEAVTIGMAGEIYLSQKMSGFPEHDADEIHSFIRNNYRLTVQEVSAGEILKLIHADKKNEESGTCFVLLSGIASPLINQHVPDELILEAISFSVRLMNQAVEHA